MIDIILYHLEPLTIIICHFTIRESIEGSDISLEVREKPQIFPQHQISHFNELHLEFLRHLCTVPELIEFEKHLFRLFLFLLRQSGGEGAHLLLRERRIIGECLEPLRCQSRNKRSYQYDNQYSAINSFHILQFLFL